MSFNNDSEEVSKSPLVEDNSHQLMQNLVKKQQNFNKIYQKMKIYFDKLDEISRDEYDDIKDEV